MAVIKCPVCGHCVDLWADHSIYDEAHETIRKNFHLKCSACGIQSREVTVFVELNYEGNAVLDRSELEALIQQWQQPKKEVEKE